jgi:riboflavin synthase
MFTGIVEEIGAVVAVESLDEGRRLTVYGPTVTADTAAGGSVAVNGVCLTASCVDRPAGLFAADLMPETVHRSSLGALRAGDPVNLEVDVIAKHVERLLTRSG